MVEINVPEKTGFVITDPYKPVIIRDMRGVMFYSTEGLTPKVKQFNLPGFGTYFIDTGNFKRLPAPVRYHLVKLPLLREKILTDPTEFEIVFTDNPHKCTISFVDRIIKFDNRFKDATLPQIYFLLYHEYGHQFFQTEKYADLFAGNLMIRKGFNISQIKTAPETTLSDKQQYRKVHFVNRLLEANGGLIS